MQTIRYVVILLSLLRIATPAVSQSTVKIAGYVYSSVTGEPLSGANIVVTGTGFGSATDHRGYFSIENMFAGEYNLEANHVGYQKQLQPGILVNKDFAATVTFRLDSKILTLDEVVVEARLDQQRSSDFQEKIELAQIQKSRARTIGELLIDVPGVDIIDEAGGSGRKRISIRGSNSNQVVILLDGIPLNDPLTGDVDLNQITLADVEEIRILKGGNSSMYGSGAIGGVVEITSRKSSVEEIRVKTRFDPYGAFGIQPSVAGNAGKLQYFLSLENHRENGNYPYSYQKADGTTVNESRLNAGFASQNYFGKLILNASQHRLQFQTNISRSTRGLPGRVFAWTPFADAKTDRTVFMATYTFQQNNWQNHLRVSSHLNESEFSNTPPTDAALRFRTVPSYHTRYRILSHRALLESGYHFGNQQNIWLQTALQADDFEDKDLLTGLSGPVRNTDNLSYGLTLRNEWHLPSPSFLSHIMLNHALRFDYMSMKNDGLNRREEQISPRIGLLLARNRGYQLNIRANWGRSFRAPTYADLFFQDFRVRGNSDLLPEKSWDFDAGIQLAIPGFNWIELSGNYFRHSVENLIVWQLGSFSTWQPSNTDALLRGWEFGGSWKTWVERIEINASHVILNAVDKSGRRTTHDKRLTYRPEHTTKIGFEIDLEPVALNYNKRLISKRFVTPSNTVSMPAYAVDDVTIRAGHRFNKFGVNLKLSIYNLFDQAYEIVERAPLPGRYWRIEVEAVF